MKTNCAPLSAPWIEDFEGAGFTPSTAFWLPGAIANCWNRDEQKDFMWSPNQPGSSSSFTGPGGVDHTTGSGTYILSNPTYLNGNANINTALETPLIDLSSLTVPELRFWYHMFGANIDSLRVEVSDGTPYTSLVSFSGQQHSSNSDPWKEAIVNLSTYVNDTIKLRFISYRSSALSVNARVSLDDIQIQEQPTCPAPSNLSVSTFSGGANVQWTSGGASNWVIRYRPAGTSTPFSMSFSSTNPATISNLLPATVYEFYVRDSCGVGDLSQWIGPVTGFVPCLPVSIPWAEDFDGTTWVSTIDFNNIGNQIDPCWSRPDSVGAHFGTRSGSTGSSGTGPISDFSGTGKYIYTEASTPGTNQIGEINSPAIIVPALSLNPRLKFAYHMHGADIDSLTIGIDTGGVSTLRLKTIVGQQQNFASSPWKMDSVNLSGFTGDTIRIRFLGGNSGFMGDIAVDEVSVISSPCPQVASSFTDSTHFLGVHLTAATINADSILWDFGDGQTDTASNPYHQYKSAGSYQVSLMTFNSCHSDTFTSTVVVCDTLRSLFHYFQSQDTVVFVADSNNHAAGFIWNLDDNKTDTSSTVVVKYDSLGTKNIRLTVFNACGDTVSTDTIIQVCPPPIASWTYYLEGTGSAGMKVRFDATASVAAVKYIWDFGDGTIDSSGPSPVHTYATAGLHYKVNLNVRNECAVSDGFGSTLQKMVSLKEVEPDAGVQIYPNPAKHHLYLKWSEGIRNIEVIKIFDMAGNPIYHKDLSPEELSFQELQIHTLKWPRGPYVVVIQKSDEIITRTIMLTD